MEVEAYRELASKSELFPLIDQALWELLNPIEFEEEIKADPRLKLSPVGYAAVKEGHIVGFVGVMDMVTRSLDGSEVTVGGIWDVATHPAYTRKGIATSLMRRAHQYFQERDYLFSLLTTGRDSIAYHFYQKLGYEEALTFPSAYKLIRKADKSTERASIKKRPDWNRISEIHRQATSDRTGLVIKTKQYMRMLELRKIIHPEKTIQTEEGYALLKEDKGNVTIKEIMAPTRRETARLIGRIEEKAPKTVIDRLVLDDKALDAYRSQGYMILTQSYSVLMAKSLAKSTGFKQVYGDRFYLSSVDLF
jgi:ribosomal protein S18 acetylase RimI-like enzyme